MDGSPEPARCEARCAPDGLSTFRKQVGSWRTRSRGISSEVCKQQKHFYGRLRGQSPSSQEHLKSGPFSRPAPDDTSFTGFPTTLSIARQKAVSRLSPSLTTNDDHGTGAVVYAAEPSRLDEVPDEVPGSSEVSVFNDLAVWIDGSQGAAWKRTGPSEARPSTTERRGSGPC